MLAGKSDGGNPVMKVNLIFSWALAAAGSKTAAAKPAASAIALVRFDNLLIIFSSLGKHAGTHSPKQAARMQRFDTTIIVSENTRLARFALSGKQGNAVSNQGTTK